jgi:hypothetical protein
VYLLLEKRRPVVATAVLAEFLAVIRGQNDDGARTLALDERHDLAHHRIGVGNLAVVAIHIAAAEVEADMPVVGLVRLEEVQPQKQLVRMLGVQEILDLPMRPSASRYSYFTYSKSKLFDSKAFILWASM